MAPSAVAVAPLAPGEGQLASFGRRWLATRRLARWLLLLEFVALMMLSGFGHIESQQRLDASPVTIAFGILSYVFTLTLVMAVVRVATVITQREIVVEAHPWNVFALISNPEAWTQLHRRRKVEAVRQLPNGSTNGVLVLGWGRRVTWEAVEHEPMERVVTFSRTTGPRLFPQAALTTLTLEPVDGGTLVRFEQRTKLHDLLGIFGLLGQWLIGREADRMLARLTVEAEKAQREAGQ